MIKNIVFDLGNVLIRFNPEKFVEENIEKEYREKFIETIFKSQEWQDLDRGTLEYKDAIDRFIKKIPKCETAIKKLFKESIMGCLSPIEKNIITLNILKNKYRLYIISNFHGPAFDSVSKKWDFFKLFQGEVISSHVKYLKPEKEIYKLLFDKYFLNPAESIFIDDSLENVEMSIKLGMDAIHLKNYEVLEKELIKKNII